MSATAFSRHIASDVARLLTRELRHLAEPGRFLFAGSFRRRRQTVNDLELVYISRQGLVPDGLFTKPGPILDAALDGLLSAGVLAKRRNVHGAEMWGPKNKLAIHTGTGLPLDFFATTEAAFFNCLVCRTGGNETNLQIVTAAQARGLKWHPYGSGFEVRDLDLAERALPDLAPLRTGQTLHATTEQAVFDLAGLPYLEPHRRK